MIEIKTQTIKWSMASQISYHKPFIEGGMGGSLGGGPGPSGWHPTSPGASPRVDSGQMLPDQHIERVAADIMAIRMPNTQVWILIDICFSM